MIKRQCVVVAAVVVVFVVVALSVIESFVSIPLQSNANRISKIRQVKKTNHTLTHSLTQTNIITIESNTHALINAPVVYIILYSYTHYSPYTQWICYFFSSFPSSSVSLYYIHTFQYRSIFFSLDFSLLMSV